MHTGPQKPLDALTSTETRARARDYRLLAATVSMARVRDALLGLARMLEQRAAEKETQEANRVHGDRGAFAIGYADGRSIVPGLRPKAEGALRPPFRTAYDAGYEIGRGDAHHCGPASNWSKRQPKCWGSADRHRCL